MKLHVYDLYGNNAAIQCPLCGEPQIVTSWNEEKRGARPCPHCGERHGIRFADAKEKFDHVNAGEPSLERVTRLYFNRHWLGQNVECQFTAKDGTVYRYNHDDVLEQVVASGSNLRNTESWKGRGIYHFPQLSAQQKVILGPYIIGRETLDERAKIGLILRHLNKIKVRCTYGAIADALGVNVMRIGGLLGEHRPEASWVVNKETLKPTKYNPENEHPDLYSNERVITSGSELMDLFEK